MNGDAVKRLLAVLFFLVLSPVLAGNFAAAEDLSIAPHTARYDVSLLEARMGDIAAANGTMEIELSRGCDAWALNTELTLNTNQADGTGFDLGVVSASQEASDGSWYTFESRVFVGGELQDFHKGRAELDEAGRGEAVFEQPQAMVLPLKSGTKFPIAATLESLGLLFNDGVRISNYVIFDGSGPTALRATDIVAGKPDPTLEGLSDPAGLTNGEAKRIVTTFFDMTQTDSEPTLTYIVDMLPNGVTTRLTIDLGFMVTEARLIDVVANEPVPC